MTGLGGSEFEKENLAGFFSDVRRSVAVQERHVAIAAYCTPLFNTPQILDSIPVRWSLLWSI